LDTHPFFNAVFPTAMKSILKCTVVVAFVSLTIGSGLNGDQDDGKPKKHHHHKSHSKATDPLVATVSDTHSLVMADRADQLVEQAPAAPAAPAGPAAVPVAPAAVAPATDIDIDTAMPYGELEPFGREDTAQELTEGSIKESDEMVDQLERAEVAEEKRAVFRALTRLRGAAITSFDGVARSQTGNIDEYNKVHKWRNTHPLRHLADEESDVAKWAFPDDADFVQIAQH